MFFYGVVRTIMQHGVFKHLGPGMGTVANRGKIEL